MLAQLKRPITSLGYLRSISNITNAVQDTQLDSVIVERSSSVVATTPQELQFLQAVTGVKVDSDEQLSSHQRSWLEYVRQQVRRYPTSELSDLLVRGQYSGNSHSSAESLTTECFLLLTRLGKIMGTEHHLSLDDAVQLLSDPSHQHLSSDALQPPLRNRARTFVFSCVSWMTMLYSSSFQPDFENLYLDNAQCSSIVHALPSDRAETPLCEFLQEFGPLLPVKNDPIISRTAGAVFFADSLYVSLLNAATLSNLGGIQIEWIDNISSHLHFDLEAKKLFMFRLPSFCQVHHHQSVALSRLLDEYYDEFSRPTGFTRNAFFKEIRLSYQLVFGDSSSSRRFFKRKELRRLRKFGSIDPEISQLCGVASRISHPRDSYSMITDFPIFASRLSTLQDHLLRQNPNSLRMIWRDTRNSYQWWTFWAVVIIGGFGILLSLIQTGLAAAQVYYAIHPVGSGQG